MSETLTEESKREIDERIADLKEQRDELAKCLQGVIDGFEQGVFVRDITKDGQADWALKLVPFVALLGRCQVALLKARQT